MAITVGGIIIIAMFCARIPFFIFSFFLFIVCRVESRGGRKNTFFPFGVELRMSCCPRFIANRLWEASFL